MDAILILIQPLDLSTGARVPVYVGDAPGPEFYGLGGFAWQPAMIERPTLKVNLFDPAMTGKVQSGTTNFTIALEQIKGVDNLDKLIWQSAPVTIFNVTQASWQNRIIEFSGIVSTPTPDLDLHTLAIEAKVSTTLLDRQMLTAKFGGGGGLDGDAALRGTYRPAGYGAVRGAPVVWFDLTRNIGQIDGYGNCLAMSRLLEGANSFGPAIADYASYAALASAIDGGAVPPGRWASCVAQGLVGLGAPPASKIQVDAIFGVNRPGSLAYSVLRYRAGIDPAVLDAAAFAALDVAVPFPVHYHTTEQRTCLDFVQALVGECNASPLVTLQGVISVTRAISSASPTLTLDRSGSIEPRVLNWAQGAPVVPYYVLNARTGRPGSTITLDQVISQYDFADQGLYQNDRTYREGQVAWLANGSQWLFIATTAAAGHAPPYPATSDAYWQQLQPATTASDVVYDDGTPLENLKPAEYGSNVTESRTAHAISGQGPGATADGTSVLNRYVPTGTNQVVLSSFARGLAGFRPSAPTSQVVTPSGAGGASGAFTQSINLSGYFGTRQVPWATFDGTLGSGAYFDCFTTRGFFGGGSLAIDRGFMMPVRLGQRIYARVLAAFHRCDFQLFLLFFDINGNIQASPNLIGGRSYGAANGDPANFDEVGFYYDMNDSSVAYAQILVRMVGTGEDQPYLFWTEPAMGILAPGQTVWPPYADGPSDPFGDKTNDNTASAINGQGLLATQNAANWAAQVTGTGKPTDNADVTAANTAQAINGQGLLATVNQADTNNLVPNAATQAAGVSFDGTEISNNSGYATIASSTVYAEPGYGVVALVDAFLRTDVNVNSGNITGVSALARLLRNGVEVTGGYEFTTQWGADGGTGYATGQVSIVKAEAPTTAGNYTYELQIATISNGGGGTRTATVTAVRGAIVPLVFKR